MAEIWFKYGKTEVFAEVDAPFEMVAPNEKWDGEEDLLNELSGLKDLRLKNIVVDYVHGVDGYSLVIESVVKALVGLGLDPDSANLFLTAWRYHSPELENKFLNILKPYFKELGFSKVGLCRHGFDCSDSLVVSPSIYWEGEITGLTNFTKYMGFEEDFYAVCPIICAGGSVAEVVTGWHSQIADTAVVKAGRHASIFLEKKPDIILLGGPGYPVDECFESCMNIISALVNFSEKVIVFVAECREGFGGVDFMNLLVRKTTSNPVWMRRYDIWSRVADRNKLVLVTALPNSLVTKLLNARQFDSIDKALTYGWRLKSKEAHVLAVPNGVGTLLEEPV